MESIPYSGVASGVGGGKGAGPPHPGVVLCGIIVTKRRYTNIGSLEINGDDNKD